MLHVESIYDPVYEPAPVDESVRPLTEFHAKDRIKVYRPREYTVRIGDGFYIRGFAIYHKQTRVAKIESNQIQVDVQTDEGKTLDEQLTEWNKEAWECVMRGYEMNEDSLRLLQGHGYNFIAEIVDDKHEHFAGFHYPPIIYAAVKTLPGQALERILKEI